MADNDKCDASSGAWGTLEELLLACAVCRHGIENWDYIAMEVQKRCSNNFFNAFTPRICERRYHALKRRFDVTGVGERNDSPGGEDAVVGGRDLREELLFMIDELRKLRVEELRRQVERHDVSIVSLQLKVKRLEAERERRSAEDEADLATRADRSGGEPGGSSAEVAGKSVSRDRSFNESNSTNRIQKPDKNGNAEPDPVQSAAEPEPDKDFSSNRGGEVVGGASQPVRLGNAGELRASVTESKREAKQQSSDVQSSASLPRRKRRRSNGVVSCCSDEIEAEEVSPANKRMDKKSQPLIKFLEIIRSHRHGSVFLRRLPSQETQKYSNLIRQHMDLETVQSKHDRGVYFDSHLWFFRDLLLIFTNAILFFCKSSTEHLAARELRRVVAKEIAAKHVVWNPKSALLVNPDLEVRSPDPVTKKPITTTNIVVCRRRRNSTSMNSNNKTKSKDEEVENGASRTKRSVDHRKKGNLAKDEPKKLKTEMSNLTTNNNANASNKKSKGTVQQGEVHKSNNSNGNTKAESSDEEEQPINKRMKQLVSSRKEGVVSFLKRIKENSPSKEAEKRKTIDQAEEKQEDRAKITDLSKKKVVVRKKIESDGGDGKDDGAATMRVSGRRSTGGGGSETTRRGGGSPTRKAAAVGGGGGGAPDSRRSKRRRDGEVVGATTTKKQPRK